MSPSDRETPPEGPEASGSVPGDAKPSGPPEAQPEAHVDPGKGEDHVSLVQRLKSHFGDVDPEINLQAREDSDSTPDREQDSTSKTPGSSRDLVERLGNQVLVGPRYTVKGEIARGGMGTILRIWDDDLRRNLAMKVMHGRGRSDVLDESDADQEKLGRFLEEAQITSQLDHPGIVPVHDLGIDDDGRCYFTMRLVRGAELKDALDAAREGAEGMTRTKVLGVILKVCEAMAYAHSKGVVHRDLKPSNIMVGRFGETYVMDWGLARVIGRDDTHDIRLLPSPEEITRLSLVKTVRRDESEANPDSPLVTMDGDVVGTPCYMAPEQAQGKLEDVGPHSDVYSLGSILYYLLSGRAPYVGDGERVSPHTVLNRVLQGAPTSVAKLAKEQPEELIAICEKAMQRDPAKRYATMLEVADDIEAFLENRVVKAYEVGSIAEFRKWVQRNRGMAAAIACAVIAAIGGTLFYLAQKEKQVADLEYEKSQTVAAKEKADQNLQRAIENERLAKDKEREALDQREEADRNAALAIKKSDEAQRSEYVANVLAVDFSLQLNDVEEAKRRLNACDAALRGWEWDHLWLMADAAISRSERIFGGISELEFDTQTNRLVLLMKSGEVKFFDLATRTLLKRPRITLSFGGVNFTLLSKPSMSVNLHQRVVAVAGRSPIVRVFELDTGELWREFPSADGEIRHDVDASTVAFSPDGKSLASGAEDGSIFLWDVDAGVTTFQLPGHRTRVTCLAWSPDSEVLASSSLDGHVFLWKAGIGMARHSLSGHSGMPVNALVWASDGSTLYTGGDDETIGVWEAELGRRQRTLTGHTQPVRSLAFDPIYQRIVSGSDDGTIRVWSEDGHSVILRGHDNPVRDVLFDPKGETVLSVGDKGFIIEMDTLGDLSQTELEPIHGAFSIESVAFSPDGKRFLSASKDQHLVLWDALSGEPLRRLRGHTNLVNAAVYSSDGRYIVSGSHDKTARLWDATTGRALRVYPAGAKIVRAVTVTRDNKWVITGAGDRKIRIYDLETSELVHELTPPVRTNLNDIEISPDGRHFATDDSLWDLENLAEGTPRATLRGIVPTVRSVAFSPDGARLVIGRGKSVFEVWDLQPILDAKEHRVQGRLLHTTRDHASWVSSATYTPDGRRIVTGSADGTIRVRSVETGETLLRLEEPSNHVEDIAVSPDARRILAAGQDGVLRIWEGGSSEERRQRRAARLAYHVRREQADPLVDELFFEHFLLSEVMLRIPEQTSVSSEVRNTALRIALMRGDDPQLLNDACLADALSTGDQANYARALRRSEAAVELTRDNPDNRVSLVSGIACYRNGRYSEASEALLQADKLDRAARIKFAPREVAWRYLFLTMSYHGEDRLEEAKGAFRSFRLWLDGQSEFGLASELQALIDEVEALLGDSAMGP